MSYTHYLPVYILTETDSHSFMCFICNNSLKTFRITSLAVIPEADVQIDLSVDSGDLSRI